MHVVIAVLNDAQFNQLNSTGIQFVEVPEPVVTELRQIYPNADLGDIALRAFKRVLGEAKIDQVARQKSQELEDFRKATLQELGLDNGRLRP